MKIKPCHIYLLGNAIDGGTVSFGLHALHNDILEKFIPVILMLFIIGQWAKNFYFRKKLEENHDKSRDD